MKDMELGKAYVDELTSSSSFAPRPFERARWRSAWRRFRSNIARPLQEEVKDSGFYLRNYKGYKAPAFEALYVWDAGEWKRYTNLTYDIEGAVVPKVGKEGMKED